MSNDEAKLFVAGLPDSIAEDVLKQIFEATGATVVNVSLPKDRATGRPRGFGFVTLSTPAEAQQARDALDGSMQGGKSIAVRPFSPEPPRRDGVPGMAGPGMGGGGAGFGGPRPAGGPAGGSFGGPPRGGPAQADDRTLYVGNLPYDCSTEEVETLINGVAAGQVQRVSLPTDPDGRKRGFGFVTMATAESAQAASVALAQADLRGRRLVINLKQPKGDRPPPRAGGFAGGGGGGYAGGGGGGYAGGGGGGYSGGGGGGGFPPPAPGGGHRKTFDDRRRKSFGGGEDGGGPKKKRGGRAEREPTIDDWKDDE